MSKKQLLYRLGQIVLVLLGISFITFALVMLSPGDPVRQMIAGNEDIIVSQQEIDALRAELASTSPSSSSISTGWGARSAATSASPTW